MNLTVSQAIGVGVAVGFAGALILVAMAVCFSRASSAAAAASSIPPGQITTTQLMPPPNPHEHTWTTAAGWESSITNSNRMLPIRVSPFHCTREINEGVYFEARIRSFVDGYVESGFRKQPRVLPSIFDESELVHLAGEPANGGSWSESISNVATRAAAVSCFLAQVMYKRMHPDCPIQDSLIPPEVSTCYERICNRPGNPQREIFVGVWRECVYLLQMDHWELLPLPARLFKEDDSRKERTRAMAPAIVNALHLESLRNDFSQKKGIVEVLIGEILEVAANSAMILLGQPSEWEAVWSSPEPGFIIRPELRFLWHGKLKDSRPAVVDAKVPLPVRSESHGQPKMEAGEQSNAGS